MPEEQRRGKVVPWKLTWSQTHGGQASHTLGREALEKGRKPQMLGKSHLLRKACLEKGDRRKVSRCIKLHGCTRLGST